MGNELCCPTTAPQPLVDADTAHMLEEAENAGADLHQRILDLEHEIERVQLLPGGEPSPPGSHDRVIGALDALSSGPEAAKAVRFMMNSQEIAQYDSDGAYSRRVYRALAGHIESARRARDNLQIKYDAAIRRISDARARVLETLQFRANAVDSPSYQKLGRQEQSIGDVRRALANAATFDAARNTELFELTRLWLSRR
jgi:hypothetical protein